MILKLLLLVVVVIVTSAREITFDELKPMPVTDFVDFGTIRITRIKKNHFSISGTFSITRNAGREKMVKTFYLTKMNF